MEVDPATLSVSDLISLLARAGVPLPTSRRPKFEYVSLFHQHIRAPPTTEDHPPHPPFKSSRSIAQQRGKEKRVRKRGPSLKSSPLVTYNASSWESGDSSKEEEERKEKRVTRSRMKQKKTIKREEKSHVDDISVHRFERKPKTESKTKSPLHTGMQEEYMMEAEHTRKRSLHVPGSDSICRNMQKVLRRSLSPMVLTRVPLTGSKRSIRAMERDDDDVDIIGTDGNEDDDAIGRGGGSKPTSRTKARKRRKRMFIHSKH